MFFNFRSLRLRIFVLTALPVVTMIFGIVWVTHRSALPTVDRSIREALSNAGEVATKLTEIRVAELARMADVIARDPRFFATFAVPEEERGQEFVTTIEQIANEFLYISDADFLEIYTEQGRICRVDRGRGPRRNLRPIELPTDAAEALRAIANSGHGRDGGEVCALATAPVRLGGQVEGALRLGRLLDRAFAEELRRLGRVDIAIRQGSETTVESRSGLGSVRHEVGNEQIFVGEVGGAQVLALSLPLSGIAGESGFELLLARPLDLVLAPIHTMERAIVALSAAGLLLMLGGGYLVARGVTRPLARVALAAERLKRGKYDYPIEATGNDEIGRLARSFVEMRNALAEHVRRLREVDKIKSDFIALAGHELKTPLTIITGFNDLISDGSFGDVPEQVQETSEIIKQQLTRLNAQVENILELTRFEQGTIALHFEETDLGALVENLVGAQHPDREGRDLEFRAEVASDLPMVVCDALRIRQALELMLDNAVRFTPDRGRITVSARMENGGMQIAVQDSGIGISPNQMPWIFEKFYEGGEINQHSSGTNEFRSGGFGLGLALCKAILDAHGSQVDVRSELGRGSVFSFVLPVAQEARVLAGV